MQLSIVLHDHKGVVHNKFRSKFEDGTTLDQLEEKIHIEWRIDKEKQQLFSAGGKEISDSDLNSTLPQIGLKNNDKIIVKHSLLENYITFLDCIEWVRKKPEERQKKQKAERALKIIDQLMKDGFFDVYTRLEREQEQLISEVAHMFDTDLGNIKKAIEYYFNSPNNIEYSEKSGGAQPGIKCHVSKEGTTRTYFVKMPCKRSSSAVDNVDLRELFIYQLFNMIGIAPPVFFLPNAHLSQVGLYIATLEVPGFKRTQKDEKKESQLSLIGTLFYVSDLHTRNYGDDDKGSMFIVDFQIGVVPDSEKAGKLWNKLKRDLSRKKLRIAKEIFYEWDLLTNINKATNIINELDFLKQLKCNHDEYKTYMAKIRGNVKTFQKEFNSLS